MSEWAVAAQQPRSRSILDRAFSDHLSLVASAALAALVTLKIFAFSRYDPQTAAGVVQIAGTGGVLVGTFVSMLPMLSVFAVGEVILRKGPWFRSLQPVERSAILASLGLPAGWLALTVPLAFAGLYLGSVLIVPALLGWIARRVERKSPSQDAIPASRTERAAVSAGFPIYVLYLIATAAWLPTESVSVDDGKPVKAYVIGARGDETVFLPVEGSKGLETAPTRQVEREYCNDSTWFEASVASLISGPRYPECP